MYSVPMALVDFIPVIFFLLGVIVLTKGLANKMDRNAYALWSAGTIDSFLAGFSKALYKLLYAANVCAFERLNAMFFPLQSIGFMLIGIGLLIMMVGKNKAKEEKLMSFSPVLLVLFSEALIATNDQSAPAEYSGTVIFIILMVLGLIMMSYVLAAVAFKMKKGLAGVCFILFCIFSLMMGYLATKNFDNAMLNWVAQGVNVFGEGMLFLGALLLDKANLKDFALKK